MTTETINPSEASTEESNRRLDREVMDMISALTSRLTSLQRTQKPGGSSHIDHDNERGVSIITMAGNNSGATMRSPVDDPKGLGQQVGPRPTPGEHETVAPLEWATLVNSNFQAVNNSIMLGTKYRSNDPGVHMDISEAPEPKGHKKKHGGWKGKGKRKEGSGSSSSDAEPHSSTGAADL